MVPHQPWSTELLEWALQNDTSFEDIKDWITSFPKERVEEDLHGMETQFNPKSMLQHAIGRNCSKCVELLVSYGCNPDFRMTEDNVPLLACAIGQPWIHLRNGTEVVRTLLSLGASPLVIPSDMYQDIMRKPTPEYPYDVIPSQEAAWCTPAYRRVLAKSLNLTMRYLLNVASRQGAHNQKQVQIAKYYNMQRLFTLPSHLIGQQYASKQILTRLWSRYCTTHQINQGKSLVFLFCGSYGHGKTELARNFGNLLNVKFKHLDATKWKYEWDVFGSSQGFVNHTEGSALNNFLDDNSGVRSLVFIDEFCRTWNAVYNTFLEVLDTGELASP